jgi:hypothetical protein
MSLVSHTVPVTCAPGSAARIESTALLTAAFEREDSTTDAPSAANACAIAKPKPRELPVMTAILLASKPMCYSLLIDRRPLTTDRSG